MFFKANWKFLNKEFNITVAYISVPAYLNVVVLTFKMYVLASQSLSWKVLESLREATLAVGVPYLSWKSQLRWFPLTGQSSPFCSGCLETKSCLHSISTRWFYFYLWKLNRPVCYSFFVEPHCLPDKVSSVSSVFRRLAFHTFSYPFNHLVVM